MFTDAEFEEFAKQVDNPDLEGYTLFYNADTDKSSLISYRAPSNVGGCLSFYSFLTDQQTMSLHKYQFWYL